MERNERKSIWDELDKYDIYAKDHDYIEVTEWTNGLGVDVNINGKMSLFTYGQIKAIHKLTKELKYAKC